MKPECALPGDKPGLWCTGDLGHRGPHADQDGKTWQMRDVSQDEAAQRAERS